MISAKRWLTVGLTLVLLWVCLAGTVCADGGTKDGPAGGRFTTTLTAAKGTATPTTPTNVPTIGAASGPRNTGVRVSSALIAASIVGIVAVIAVGVGTAVLVKKSARRRRQRDDLLR